MPQPRGAGQGRRHEPFPLPPRVQGGHRPDAESLCRRAARPRACGRSCAQCETVTEAIYGAGYNSSGRFYATSDAGAGHDADRATAPAAPNTEIRFAVGECSLGAILVAATERGVCAILLGDDPDALVRDLQDRFPQARLHRRRCRRSSSWSRRSSASSRRRRCGLDLPLDMRGTAFQQRVWQALRRSRRARPRATRRSPRGSARRKRCARWRRPAAPTRSRWRSRATASCATTARSPATAGASSASARCSTREAAAMEHARTVAGQPRRKRPLSPAARIAAIDWTAHAPTELDAQGSAVLARLLTPEECRDIAALYPQDDTVPQPGRDGAPRLRPRRVQVLRLSAADARRGTAHGALPAAGADRQSLERGDGDRRCAIPPSTRDFLARCHAAGQTRPTPLLLQYGAGDYNCLHQDLYGEHVFPLQVAMLLSRAGPRLRRRRVRADRAAAAHAVARRGGAAAPGRRGGLRRASPAGAGHARHLPRQPAPRRQPRAVGPAAHARHHLPRCQREQGPMLDLFARSPDAGPTRGPGASRWPPALWCCAASPRRRERDALRRCSKSSRPRRCATWSRRAAFACRWR